MDASASTDQLVNFVTPQTGTTSSFSFLCLPRELRDYIYDKTFLGSCFQFHVSGFVIKLSYKTTETRPNATLPLGLFANTHILSEGLEQLYRESKCIFAMRDVRLPQLGSNIGGCRVISTGQEEQKLKSRFGKLLALKHIRTFDIGDVQLRAYMSFPIGHKATLYIYDVDKIVPVNTWLHLRRHSTNHLKLTFVLPGGHIATPDMEEWDIEFRALEYVRCASKVEFVINRVDGGNQRAKSACKKFMPELQQKFISIGQNLVGEKGKKCVVRVWYHHQATKVADLISRDWHALIEQA